MSKYSLLGVCQPQRGGLSYFCGLSLPPACATTRDGHTDRDCRSGDGPVVSLSLSISLLIDHLRTYRGSPSTSLIYLLHNRISVPLLSPEIFLAP